MSEWVTSRIKIDDGLKTLYIRIKDYDGLRGVAAREIVEKIKGAHTHAEAWAFQSTPISALNADESIKAFLKDSGSRFYRINIWEGKTWLYFIYPPEARKP